MVPCEDFLQGVPVPKGCPPPTTKCLSFHSSEPACVSPTPIICWQVKNVTETAKSPGLEINTRCKHLNLGRKHFRLKPQWIGSQGKTSFPRQERSIRIANFSSTRFAVSGAENRYPRIAEKWEKRETMKLRTLSEEADFR